MSAGVNLLDDGVDRHLGVYQYQSSIDFRPFFWCDSPRKLQRLRFVAFAELPRGRSDMNPKVKSQARQWSLTRGLCVALLLIIVEDKIQAVRAQSEQSSGAQIEAAVLPDVLSGSEKLTLV